MTQIGTAPVVAQQWPNYCHSYAISWPGDNFIHDLAELAFCPYAGAGVARDRAVIGVTIQLDSAETAPIYVGGPDGCELEIVPGNSHSQAISTLGAVAARNPGPLAKTVRIHFTASDR